MAKQSEDSLVPFVLGLVAGAIGGAVVALLLAPKSGEELRENMQDYLSHIPDKIDDELKNPQGKTREFIDRTRYNIENTVDKVRAERKADRLSKARQAEEMASGYEFNP